MMHFLVLAGAWLVAFILTPLTRRLALRWGFVAFPGGRRSHSMATPTLGGVPLLIAWLAALIPIYWLLSSTGDDALRLRGVVLGTLLVFAGGLLDEKYDLSPLVNLAIQIAGAAVAIGHIVFIELFTNPITGQEVWIRPRWIAVLFTIFWIVGMMNTVNWLDGLDGLAVGVGAIAAILFAWHSYRLGQTAVSLFPLALAGALLGFLPFNFAPAKIFLGTAGVYMLGYQLATLSILSPAKIATALLVMAVPILDTGWLIVERLARGQSPLQGDRRHLHFRLLDRGIPVRRIVLCYYAVTLALGGIVLMGTSPAIKLAVLMILGVVMLAVLYWLSRTAPQSDV